MKKELDFFDKPRNVSIFLKIFFISLGVLLIIDFFIHKHADFYWESAPNFFAVYGFVSCVALIYIAKALRWFIKRDEHYYDWDPHRNNLSDENKSPHRNDQSDNKKLKN